MAEHFNQLTPAQAERLAILAEEAGEIVQAVGKILRHGYDNYNPANRDINNRLALCHEIGDLQAVVEDMVKHGDVLGGTIDKQKVEKLRRLSVGTLYLHHQRDEV